MKESQLNLYKLIILTPLLYPKHRGFTIWNLLNIAISSTYPYSKEINKYNANNTAAVFFSSMCYYLIDPKNFIKWLKKENISHIIEKIVHCLPFLYYLKEGYYDYSDYKLSTMSLASELVWAYSCGNNFLIKNDMYYKMDKRRYWYCCWMMAVLGHYLNVIPIKNVLESMFSKIKTDDFRYHKHLYLV